MQVIPHVTNEIKAAIQKVAHDVDVASALRVTCYPEGGR